MRLAIKLNSYQGLKAFLGGAKATTELAIKLNSYQGLKVLVNSLSSIWLELAIKLNSYQGLKVITIYKVGDDTKTCNQTEFLSGIESDG